MINITGIDDIDRIIYDYKNNMEIWESLYTFLLKHLTPCPPIVLCKRGVLQFDTAPEDVFNLNKLCEDLLNNYNDDDFYRNDIIFFKTEYIAIRGIITQYLPKTGKLNLYKYARLWISDDNRLDKYWIRK